MKTPGLLTVLSIVLFCGFGSSLFFVSRCSDQRSATNRQSIHSDTPRLSVERLDNGAFINRNGWYIPDKSNTKRWTPQTEDLNSEQGKPVRVLITTFTLNDSVFYEEEYFANGVTQLYGELKLMQFEEYRANDKVYAFMIQAKRREIVGQKLDAGDHNEKLLYRIVDSDGDGTFETLFDDDREVAVPTWASK